MTKITLGNTFYFIRVGCTALETNCIWVLWKKISPICFTNIFTKIRKYPYFKTSGQPHKKNMKDEKNDSGGTVKIWIKRRKTKIIEVNGRLISEST